MTDEEYRALATENIVRFARGFISAQDDLLQANRRESAICGRGSATLAHVLDAKSAVASAYYDMQSANGALALWVSRLETGRGGG